MRSRSNEWDWLSNDKCCLTSACPRKLRSVEEVVVCLNAGPIHRCELTRSARARLLAAYDVYREGISSKNRFLYDRNESGEKRGETTEVLTRR